MKVITQKKNKRKVIFYMITLLIIGAAVVLGGSTATAASKKLKVKAQKTVAVNCKMQIRTNKKVTFKSSNKKIATVTKKGVVTGKRAGKVTITVRDKKNKKQIKKIKITVKNKLVVFNPRKSKVTLYMDDTLKIKTNIAVKYKKNNSNIKINKKGVVTPCKIGTTKVTITSKKFKKLKKKITIVVKKKEEAKTENPTQESSTESETEEQTTESGSAEEKTTENNTKEEGTENTSGSTENEDSSEDKEETKTGYSRMEWVKEILEAVRIQPKTAEMIPSDSLHQPLYTYHDNLSEEELLLLETAVEEGILQGVEDDNGLVLFNPGQGITREDATVMAVKALKYVEGDIMPTYSDVASLQSPYLLKIAVDQGMISLQNGAFCGKELLSYEDGKCMLQSIKNIYQQNVDNPKQVTEVDYNDELIMETVQSVTDYTVTTTETGYVVTIPLSDVQAMGIEEGKTMFLPADAGGMYPGGFPCNIESITTTETSVEIVATAVTDISDVFDSYHLAGSVTEMTFVPADGVLVVQEEGEENELSAQKSSARAKDKKSIVLEDGKTSFVYENGNRKLEIKAIKAPELEFDFCGDITKIEYLKVAINQEWDVKASYVKSTEEEEDRILLGELKNIHLGCGFLVQGCLYAVVTAEGDVSFECTIDSTSGFVYDGELRDVSNETSTMTITGSIGVEAKLGVECSIFWVNQEYLTIVKSTVAGGVGAKIQQSLGNNVNKDLVSCAETTIYRIGYWEITNDENSLLCQVLKIDEVKYKRSLPNKIYWKCHRESVGATGVYNTVEYCSVANNILSGRVIDENNNTVPNATIRIEDVNNTSRYYMCYSNTSGEYIGRQQMPEGKYHITAYWDNGKLKYDQIVELTVDKFEKFDITEVVWTEKSNMKTCLTASGVLYIDVTQDTNVYWIKHEINDIAQEAEKVVISGELGSVSMGGFFAFHNKLKSIDLSELDTSRVTSMSRMIMKCPYLEEIDLSGVETSNVTDMSQMFGVANIKSLDLSSFDTSKVTNMSGMFYRAGGMERLDLSNFDTSKVTDMSSMFYGCVCLNDIRFGDFDTSKVTDMSNMFYNCKKLQSIDLEPFETQNVTDMSAMFWGCELLKNIDMSNFETGNVTTMSAMFQDCINLENIDLSMLDTSELVSVGQEDASGQYGMFADCVNLKSVNMQGLDAEKVTNTNKMFYRCKNLESVEMTDMTTGSLIDMQYMFGDCYALQSIDLSMFKFGDGADLSYMFQSCKSIKQIDFSGWNNNKIKKMNSMLNGCASLTSVNLSVLNVSSVTDMSALLADCDNLSTITLGQFDAKNVTDLSGMFSGCSSLETLDLSGFSTANVEDMSGMFSSCDSLTEVDLTAMNTSKVKDMSYMFEDCTGLKTVNLEGVCTDNVQTMTYMFENCSQLTQLDLSSFDVGDVTDFTGMFADCTQLESLYLGNFVTSSATTMSRMFYGCSGLSGLDVSGFDTSQVIGMEKMFYGCSGLTDLDLSNFDMGAVSTMRYMFYNCIGLESLDVSSFDLSHYPDKKDQRIITEGMFSNCKDTIIPEWYNEIYTSE